VLYWDDNGFLRGKEVKENKGRGARKEYILNILGGDPLGGGTEKNIREGREKYNTAREMYISLLKRGILRKSPLDGGKRRRVRSGDPRVRTTLLKKIPIKMERL